MRLAIASVNYADCLAVSLPAWLALIPVGLWVATSPDDRASKEVALDHGVPVYVTDAWTRPQSHDVRFNLALGLDEALGLVPSAVPPPKPGELMGHVSADCVPFGSWPKEKTFDADAVYGFWRYECLTPKALETHRRAPSLGSLKKLKNSHGWPIGYNQIFRYQPGLRFGSYPSAGKFDTDFSRQFRRQVMRNEIYFLHLGPVSVKANWSGRVIPQWGTS